MVHVRLEITRRAELAVRALFVVANSDAPLKATDLADALGATNGFVPQVMAPLVKAGWVSSHPGPTGGYTTSVDLAAVTVLDVIEAVDGPTADGRCVVADSACDARHPCVLHDAWALARAELMGALDSVKICSIRHGDIE
jgi:Rrf2 family protein